MSGQLAPRPLVGIVADDITGSGDIGIMFAKHGYAVRIYTADTDLAALPAHLKSVRTDVAIIDTDSRLDTPEAAAAKVRRAAAALREWGAELYWKKTCSVFRGNVGAEFDALIEEIGEQHGLAVAAFPRNGRATRQGIHYVHSKPLHESEFRNDPVHPRTESNLIMVLQAQTENRVRLLPLADVRNGPDALLAAYNSANASGVAYSLCDCETQEDLAAIARVAAGERVLLGSSALAEELPPLWEPPDPFDPLAGLSLRDKGGVLVVAGSVMPQSRAQVEALEQAGATVLTLTGPVAFGAAGRGALPALARQAVQALQTGKNVVIRSENWPDAVEQTKGMGARLGLDPVAVNRAISLSLAKAAQLVLLGTGAHRLITLGGDTSAAVCRQLGVTETVVLEEIAPGLPSTLAPGPRPLLMVLKSGSFGSPDFGLRAIEHLRNLGG